MRPCVRWCWYVAEFLSYDTLTNRVQHLNKVQEHYAQNRMNAGNLAICFG